MRRLLIVLVCLLSACRTNEEKLRAEYLKALERESVAYSGSDAAKAYEELTLFLNHVKRLESAGAPIPAKDVLIWDTARLGLLAEHLGKKDEAARLFAIAAQNSQKAYGSSQGMNEVQLRAALEQMDTPDKYPWRRK